MVAPLPAGIIGHYGAELRRFVLAQVHRGQVTVPRLVAQLDDLGIAISKRRSLPPTRSGVTRRKISAGTRSDAGRDCRHGFLGLIKTCDRLDIGFWDYLGSRLQVPDAPFIPPLADLIRQRAAT